MTATDNETQDRLGIGPKELIDNVLDGLVQKEWARVILAFLDEAGLLDRRKAMEAMRDYALTNLKALERNAGKARACLEAGDPNDVELDEDMPPAMRRLVLALVGLETRDPDADAVVHAEHSIEDFCLWYLAEDMHEPETPEQERAVHVPLTWRLMEELIDDNVRQALAARIRGKGV